MTRKLVLNRVSGCIVNTKEVNTWGKGLGEGSQHPGGRRLGGSEHTGRRGLSITALMGYIYITYMHFKVKEGTFRLSDSVGRHWFHTTEPAELIKASQQGLGRGGEGTEEVGR